MPRTGLAVRLFHESADKMSEAVNSDVLSGGGKVDIRRFLSPTLPGILAGAGHNATTHDTVHGQYFPQARAGFWHSLEGKQANVLFALGFNPMSAVPEQTYRAQLPAKTGGS
jgi:hypothetical protein